MNESLAKALKFTEEDLQSNQAGRLSPNQIAKLNRYQNQRLLFSILVLGAAAIFTWLIAAKILPAPMLGTQLNFMVIAWIVVFLIEAVYFLRRGKYNQEITDGRIKLAEGKLHRWLISYSSSRYSERYSFIEIAGQRLAVTSKIFEVFSEGHQYRIYYTPYSKTIFAAEFLK